MIDNTDYCEETDSIANKRKNYSDLILSQQFPSAWNRSSEIHAAADYFSDYEFDLPEFLRDGVPFFVAVGALVDFQHDGDAVGVALPGEDGVRDETACVGVVDLGGVAGALEGSFGDD